MIKFKKLTWKNFLSTGNVAVEIDFDKSPNTLVVGVNGAGKSTMLDALTFVLFGKSFRGVNLPGLVNSINEKECLVDIDFSIGSKQYKIERGIKPAVFNIFIDGVLLNQDAKAKDYQKVLESQILKFNYKAFTQIVLLGSSSFKPFMQLPALDRRVVIEDLLDIEIFSSMMTIVKSKLAEIKDELASSKIKLDSTLEKIELQKKYVEEAKKNSSDLIANKQEEYDKNEKYVSELTANVALVQQHIDILMSQIADEMTTKSTFHDLTKYEIQIGDKLKKASSNWLFFSDNDNCPTCQQNIDPEFKAKAIETAKTDGDTLKIGFDKLKEQKNKLNKRLADIAAVQTKIYQHQNELTRINASVTQVQLYMKKLQSEIGGLRTKKVLSDDMKSVSEQLIKDLETVHKLRTDLTEEKKYYDVASALLKDNGIKTRIIKQYLPVINKLINKYLTDMDAFYSFDLDEEFKETIKSRYRDKFQYESFSEGEKFRIDMAILCTWRDIAKMKNSVNTNLLILDEIFDRPLDYQGIEDFVKLIHSFQDMNVFIISPKGDSLTDKFKHGIKFDKIGGFSRIV